MTTEPPNVPFPYTDPEAPWLINISSKKSPGISERSIPPVVIELTGKPFHITEVWFGPLPRSDMVAREPDIPYKGILMEVKPDKISPRLDEPLYKIAEESILVIFLSSEK